MFNKNIINLVYGCNIVSIIDVFILYIFFWYKSCIYTKNQEDNPIIHISINFS